MRSHLVRMGWPWSMPWLRLQGCSRAQLGWLCQDVCRGVGAQIGAPLSRAPVTVSQQMHRNLGCLQRARAGYPNNQSWANGFCEKARAENSTIT